jgi:UDP-N-acetylmuramate--alanine ligase
VSGPDLSAGPRRIHLVGIGGAGMSAIATVLAEMGHRVSGSDAAPSATLDRLAAAGIRTTVGHSASNIRPPLDFVAVSTAVPPTNPEVLEAVRLAIPVLRRAEVLAAICSGRDTVAVAGTHGKTTTSSLLAEVLTATGRDPGFIIGAEVRSLGRAARWGTGADFVVEADESDGSAFELPRTSAIVTNVEPDHLEHHGGFEQLRDAFDRFVTETDGVVVACADDPVAADLAARHRGAQPIRTYGLDPGADYRIVDLETVRSGVSWRIVRDGVPLAQAAMSLPGVHNATNATAAVALASELGVDPVEAAAALGNDSGVARRFELRGEARGVTFVDDYAHLPTEVAAALAAAAGGGWDRVVAVFQPHRYSRTEALWRSFADAFGDADVLVVTGIYPAGEPPRAGVTGELVLQAVVDAHPGRPSLYVEDLDELAELLEAMLRPGDLCLTLGAGDLTTIPSVLMDRWA